MRNVALSLSIGRSAPMDDEAKGGLQHTPTGAALSLHSSRSSILARGRRDAANAASNPHYQQGVLGYKEERFVEAVACFRLAAEQGHAESQYLLSTIYDAGLGVAKDDAYAAHWERKAAEQGHAYAQANVSFRSYRCGNFAEAFLWCQRAAYSHLAWAEYNLGLMYQKGEGVAQNDADAAYWYRQAAAQGYAEAQQKLGELSLTGTGMPRSDAEAAGWYRKAADQGNAEAQFQLAQLYAIGQGVDHDYVASRQWIRRAAQQGHEQAMRELKRREYRDA